MSTIPLAQCTHAPCRTSSKQASFSSPNKLSTASSNQLKYYLIAATVLLLLSLLAAPGTVYSQTEGTPVTVRGTLEVLVADSPQGQVTMIYFLQAEDGSGYELLFTAASPPSQLRTGQRAEVTGIIVDNKLQVDTLELATAGEELAAMVTERRAVVILVDLQNVKASSRYTRDQVATALYALNMAGTPAPAGTRSVRELYQQASLGQLDFVPDSDNNGVPDVFGPVTIDYSYTSSCDYQHWTLAAESAVQQAGIDLNRYQHRVFVLPRHSDISACGWSGLANVGCGTYCRVWIAEAESPMVYAHELGHNLGMGHAGTDPENDGTINSTYGDYSDTMGSSRSWHLFNAAHVDQMRWYGDYANSIVTITASGTYDLNALEATLPPNPLPVPRIIRLQQPNNQGYYYLSYRRQTGYDSSLSSLYTQGVNIHRYQGSDSSVTAFVKALTDGATFSDSATGIVVTQVSHSADHATVNINLGCTGVAPVVTLSPDSRIMQPGEPTSYTVTVRNQDGADCAGTTFTLSYTGTPGGILMPSTLSLSPGGVGTATLQLTTAGLVSASYALQVQASDSDGVAPSHATAGSGTTTLIVDSTPPTIPTGLQGAVDVQNRISLNWNAATDALSGVQHYKVYRDNVAIGQSGALLYTDSAITPGATYRYTVAAVDGAGNESTPSALIAVATGCAAANPLVILSPSKSVAKLNVMTTYTVTVSNRDNSACAPTTFSLAYSDDSSSVTGTLATTALHLAPGQSSMVTLQVKGSSNGVYTVWVQATDNDGVAPNHDAITASALFVADGAKPTTPTGLKAVASPGQIVLSWTAATDAHSGVRGYVVYRNRVAITETSIPSYTDTAIVAGTTYEYKVVAKDLAENVSSQSSGIKVKAQ